MPPELETQEKVSKTPSVQVEEVGADEATSEFEDRRSSNNATLKIKKAMKEGNKKGGSKALKNLFNRRKAKSIEQVPSAYYYTLDENQNKFTPSNEHVIEGSEIVFAAKVTSHQDFARIGIKNGEGPPKFVYVRIEDFSDTNLWPWSFGETGLLKPINYEEFETGRDYKKGHRDWYVNFAILYDAYQSLEKIVKGKDKEKAKKAKETQHRIALTILQNYAKAAGEGSAERSLGKQVTAFNENVYYHRNNGGGLTDKINEFLQNKLDIPNSIQVISDPFVSEAIERNFPVLYKESASSKKVNTTIDSINSLRSSIEDLCANHPNELKLEDNIVFNVTEYYNKIRNSNSEQKAINEVQTNIAKVIESTVMKYSEEYFDEGDYGEYEDYEKYKELKIKQNEKSRIDLINGVIKKTKFVIVTEYEGIHYMVSLNLNFTDKEDYEGISSNIDSLTTMLNHSGMTIGPLSAKEALLKLSSLEELLHDNTGSSKKIPLLTLDTKGNSKNPKSTTEKDNARKPEVTPFTFNNFIKHTTLKKFEELKEKEDRLPYIQIYVPATIDLLNGLKEKTNIDEEFEERGINGLLEASCYRMLIAMANAIRVSGNMIHFLNHIEVIHNQIQMILAIVNPYKQDIDFTEAIQGILTDFYMPEVDEEEEKVVEKEKKIEETQPEKKSKKKSDGLFSNFTFSIPWSIINTGFFNSKKQQPKNIPHKYNPIAADSLPKEKPAKKPKNNLGDLLKRAEIQHKASAMHVTSSTLAAVEKEKGTNNLNVLVLKDNYYEAVGFEKKNGLVLEAKTYNVSVLNGRELDEGTSLDKAIKGKDNDRFDVFLCDFHHNISTTLQEYKAENLVAHVQKLFKEDKVASKFTVAIDSTIDFIRSKDIQEFLEAFKDKITSGQLNVVIYRSAQKFDMLGLDNYYGGYSITINNRKSYEEFNKRISNRQDNIKGLAHQGLTHLNTHASHHLDAYRKAIIKNNKMFYDKLMEAGLGKKYEDHFYIAKNSDPNMVFIDFRGTDSKNICYGFKTKFEYVTERFSFGFATTNYAPIGSRTRITVGLESEETIDQYVDYLELKYKAKTGPINTNEKINEEIAKRKSNRAKRASFIELPQETQFSMHVLSDHRLSQILSMLNDELKYKYLIEEEDKLSIKNAIIREDKEVLETYTIERFRQIFCIRKKSDDLMKEPNTDEKIVIIKHSKKSKRGREFYTTEETQSKDSISASELDKNEVLTSKEQKMSDKIDVATHKTLVDQAKINNKLSSVPSSAGSKYVTINNEKFELGTASGSNNNCLIFSIAKALNVKCTSDKAKEIRKHMIDMKISDVGESNFLENDGKILTAILQSLGENPNTVSIVFNYRNNADEWIGTDKVTYYNEGASRTLYIANYGQIHFVPMFPA